MVNIMHVKIGDIIIEDPDLEYASRFGGAGSYGFEFKGLSLEDKGKQIVKALNAAKGQLLECEAFTMEGVLVSGYGKLEIFDYESSEEAPIKYRFSGTVVLEQ